MTQYVVRRLVLIVPTLLIVSIIVFSLVRLIPGDVVVMMLVDQDFSITEKEQLRHILGFDRPIYLQYFDYLGKILGGDLGFSLWSGESVLDTLFKKRLPVSVELGGMAVFFSIVIAIPVGVMSAIRQDTWLDYVARVLAIGGLSIPGFWIATLVIVLPSIWFGYIPPIRYVTFAEDPLHNLQQFVVPAAIMGLAMSAGVMRMTRSMMLEVLRQDYIRTAWAKGLRERVIISRHALKNALIPVVTIIGMQVSGIVGGSVIFETIFALPGVGSYMFVAVNMRDYPVVQGVNLVLATFVVTLNFLVDVTYSYLDPRIRY